MDSLPHVLWPWICSPEVWGGAGGRHYENWNTITTTKNDLWVLHGVSHYLGFIYFGHFKWMESMHMANIRFCLIYIKYYDTYINGNYRIMSLKLNLLLTKEANQLS